MLRCTFDISAPQRSGQVSRLSSADKKATQVLGSQILNQISDLLDISDKESCQIRVVAKQIPQSKTSISLTSGAYEQRDYPDQEAFPPPKEQVHVACVVAQALGQESGLRIGLTCIELWRETTFLVVDREASSEGWSEPEAFEGQEGISKFIKNPKITLVVSPEIAERFYCNRKKAGEAGEPPALPHSMQAKEMADLTSEVLGLPGKDVEAAVIVAAVADTDFSAEFDCQTEGGYRLSGSARRYLAKRIERYLISNRATKGGKAEVWIRQNEPETMKVYASPYRSSVAETPEEIEAAHKLRNQVFVVEQNVPADIEVDEDDRTATHVIVKLEDRVVGTGRLVIENEKGKIGRVAVDAQYRHQDIGTRVMVRLEDEARKRDLDELYLHAQTYASKFYRLLGYKPRGETLYEAGIEHIEMYKKIKQGVVEES